MDSNSQSEGETSPNLGRWFAIGIALLCLMVVASTVMMFVSAKKDAVNRAQHPVIGQP